MEPRIQYAKTADGVNIAFYTTGDGPALVIMPIIVSSIQADLQFPQGREFVDRLGAGRKVVRYDRRGTGASDRDVVDVSLETQLLDLEAIVERLDLDAFAIWPLPFSVAAAVTYAVRHPERVSHLILSSSYARGSDYLEVPQVRAWSALIDKDWEFFSQSMARFYAGWSAQEADTEFAAVIRDCLRPEILQASLEAIGNADVTALLPDVSAPTLVVHPRDGAYPDLDAARELASRIPDARLAVLKGGWRTLETSNALIAAVTEFLAETGHSPASLPAGMTAILFADIADSTGMTERLGDAPFREKARALDAALRGVIRENGGTPIEGRLLGDGVLAVFTSARQAIEAALQCGKAGDEAGLPLHLGLHAGDVIREEGNVYGGAVNIAARISALSAPGEVLVSATVRSLARTSAGVSFEDRGDCELKGVSEPVRVWAVPRQAQDERESA